MRKEAKMWENKEFRVKFRENEVRDFEKVMLTSGECSIFIPMGFISEDGCEYGLYDCSGFAPMSVYQVERTEDALYILENVLLILGRAVEYFIDPARVSIRPETVFYNKETGQIKLAYVPCSDESSNMRENIVMFIGELKAEIRDGKSSYLTEAAKYIYYHNYSLRDMINKAGLLKRRVESEKYGDNM